MPPIPPRLATGATAVVAGVLLCLSLPPFGFWPLAFVGLVLVDRLIAHQPRGARFARGWLVAMGCFVPGLSWMTALTVPGTVIACVAYSAMLGAGIAAAPPGRGRWLALAGTWTVAELLRSSWPFGGVPLASLPIGQVAGPLAAVLRLGGPVLLLVCTILVGQSLAALVRGAWLPAVGLLAIPLVVLGAAQVAPQGHAVATAEIALVQGGGAQGTRQSKDSIKRVFAAHVEATALVEPPVDLMVWPEDVIDTPTPLVEDPWGIIVGDLARAKNAPLLVGAIEDAGEGYFRNAVELFDAEGQLVGRYEKVHRVPFGEWVPFRPLLAKVADGALPRRDAVIGEIPNYLDVPGPVGRVVTPISWEIFFPDRTREGVEAGARLVVNPTNGSSFTGTIVQTQQLASSRMRAIESGRWVAQVAPTGFSAIIGDTGRIIERSSISETQVIQREVQLREGLTIYTRYGNLIGLILAAACILSGWTIEVVGTRRRQAGASLA